MNGFLPLASLMGDNNFLEEFEMNKSISLLAATAASCLAYGDVIEIDLAGVNSNDNLGAAINDVLSYDLGDIVLTGIGWDNVQADGFGSPSWGNEMNMNVAGAFSIAFFPNEGSGSAGGPWGPASSDGIISLADALGGDVALNGDALTLEFFESYDDANRFAKANALEVRCIEYKDENGKSVKYQAQKEVVQNEFDANENSESEEDGSSSDGEDDEY